MSKDIHTEIERVAYDLYEQSGREYGKDLINWLAAEKIVLGRLALAGRIAGEDTVPRKKDVPRRRSGNGRRRNSAA